MDQNLDVALRDFNGNILSSFWQYGIIDWELFYSCLRSVISSNEDWAVFRYEAATPGQHGASYPPSPKIPEPGTYILLRPDGTPIKVGWTTLAARVRHPTLSNTATQVSYETCNTYLTHARRQSTTEAVYVPATLAVLSQVSRPSEVIIAD